MSEEDYRHHMTKVSAPLTQDLMVKYGVVRWTMVSPFLPTTQPNSFNLVLAHGGCQALRSYPPGIYPSIGLLMQNK